MKSRHIRGLSILSIFGSMLLPFCLTVAASPQGTSRDKQNKKNLHPLKQEGISTWGQFLDGDVPYIITDEERAAAKKLTTEQQRDDFITAFWERRNPNPGLPENAFKEEHYRRIAYANEHFACNVAGWKTDRGRIYIIYGPPNSVESPQRLPPPTEIWRYVSVQRLGQNVVLTFTDKGKDGSFSLTDEDVDSLSRIRDGQMVY